MGRIYLSNSSTRRAFLVASGISLLLLLEHVSLMLLMVKYTATTLPSDCIQLTSSTSTVHNKYKWHHRYDVYAWFDWLIVKRCQTIIFINTAQFIACSILASLTHCGLVTRHGDMELDQHSFLHQAIYWTNVDFLSLMFCSMHERFSYYCV